MRGDDEGTAAWAALLRVHAAVVPKLERELRAARNLSLAWYDVLLVLNAAPGRRLRMQDLATAAVLSRTRISRVVVELTAAGLVRREADPADRRSSFAALTTAGRNTLRAAAPFYLQSIADHFTRHLTNEEVALVRTALQKVRDAEE
ncbi:MAG: MarR family winged helix-turn-helix transcriptional regulator [Egibacteraceae bacterium]